MLELSDYLELLKKRKWVILAWFIAGLAGAGVAFMVMPKAYRSSTLVLVESQKIPTDYIKPMATDTIEERLITIQQQILSRTLLQKIIEEHNLYPDDVRSLPMEDVIDEMRQNIKITTVDDRMHRNIQAFTISFDGPDPVTVMQVTNKLASMFIGENLKVREQLVEGTSEFLEHELQTIKEKLDRQEAEISKYKQKYMGQLPTQAEANLRSLDRLQMELQTQDDALRMLMERRDIVRDFSGSAYGATKGVGGERTARAVSPRARLRQLRHQLIELQSEYKDTYPDVIKVRKEIKDLETQIARGPSKEDLEDEVIAEGEGDTELRTLDAEIKVRRSRKAELERQVKQFEDRVEAMPMREQELSVLLRDYNNTNAHYQQLLQNKESAKVTEHLEKRQKGEQFRVLDPANLPIKPVKPNPLKVFLGGLAIGLACAGGTIWWLDFRNMPFRRPEEVEAATDLPILATLPRMYIMGDGEELEKPLAIGDGRSWTDWVPRLGGPTNGDSNGQSAPVGLRERLPSRVRSQRITQAHMNALGAEQFRVLAGRLVQTRDKKGIRVMAVTSALAGEGKTTVALGVAITLARDYLEETILVDGDIR
ncbi:MAG TPA: Wzz/FepE/Etk N-terminal domain-containing protein, partial [Nitrospirales bacterium]|nr:Wzz/FepE/Etk N-terminal domain-containing protein [Nitrospirales bacterium]